MSCAHVYQVQPGTGMVYIKETKASCCLCTSSKSSCYLDFYVRIIIPCQGMFTETLQNYISINRLGMGHDVRYPDFANS